MLDRGVIDEEIAEQRILPRLPERLHDAARGLIEKWDDPIVPVEGMLELLQALKAKGYRLYLLSNAATRQPIYWARAEASKLMDGALISAAKARPADLPHLPAQVRPSPGGMRLY